MKHNHRRTKEEKESNIDFLKENYLVLGPKECAKRLKSPIVYVVRLARRLQLKLSKETVSKLKSQGRGSKYPTINPELWKDLNSPEKSYIAGLLWSDGHFMKYTIQLTIAKDDADEILEVFEKTGPWVNITKKKGRNKTVSHIFTRSIHIYELLDKMDFGLKKFISHSKILSQIKREFHPYFWRGFFDGDGCIYSKNNNRQVIFTSSFNQDWTTLEALCENLGINGKISRQIYKTKNNKIHKGSYFKFSKKEYIKRFFSYIYGSHLQTFGLSRKFLKLKEATATNAKTRINATGFRGVTKYKNNFVALAPRQNDGPHERIGVFSTAEEAAVSYDIFVVKCSGMKAITNFPITNYTNLISKNKSEEFQ